MNKSEFMYSAGIIFVIHGFIIENCTRKRNGFLF